MSNQFSNKYTEQDYINKCNKLNLTYIGNHKEKKLGTIIDFICPTHKNKGIQSKDWSHFKTYNKGCTYCTGRQRTTDEFIELIKEMNIKVLSNYMGCEKKIKLQCEICGNIWETIPKVLITNHSGCPKCGFQKRIIKRTLSHSEFVERLRKVNKNIEVISKYQGTHKKIKCRCKIDNFEWESYPANLLNLSAGCPMCSMSLGESKLLQILDELKINYKTQYQIEGCKNINNLKFDAFDIENNIAFEYNGEQHYRPVDFSNHNINRAEETFKKTKARDLIKYNFCKEHNIPLIIIPYTKRNKMKEFIVTELQKLNFTFNN
jgi:hypothetical protein